MTIKPESQLTQTNNRPTLHKSNLKDFDRG